MLAKYRKGLGVLAAVAASATWCGTAVGQYISAVPVTPVPTATGQPVSVNIVNSSEPDSTTERDDIIGYHFKISYNSSEVTFNNVTDPVGAEDYEGRSGPGQTGDAPATGFSDFVIIEGDSAAPVADRGALATLNFTTGASYSGSLDLNIDSYPTADSGLTILNAGSPEHITPVIDNDGTVYTIPTLTSISQHYNVIDEATADYTLTVTGSNFEADTVFEFDGAALSTTVDSSTQLTVTLPNELVDQVGEWLVNVDNGDNVESVDTVYYTAVSQATVNVDDDFAGSFEQRIAAGQIFGVNVFNSIQNAENAVNANGTVEVADGSYVEKVVVDNTGVTIIATGSNAEVTAPASGTNGALIDVRTNDVTVQGFDFLVNRPYVTAGVVIHNSAAGTNYDNLSVVGNTFAVSGTGGDATGFVGFGTQTVAILAANHNGAQTDVLIAGNEIGSAAAPFDRAVFTRVVRGTIGGPAPFDAAVDPATKGNIVYGENHDLVIQFVSNGTMLVENNALRGWGSDNFKGAQVDFTEPGSTGIAIIRNNVFEPQAGTSPFLGRTHVRSVMIKNNDSTPNVTIENNTFSLRAVGILAGNSIGTNIKGNTFTPASGVANSIAVAISNKVPTGGTVSPDPIGATITGNTFNGGDVAGNTAIEFMNHNSTPVPSGGHYGNITVGLTGEENIFEDGLAKFIVLNNESGPSSGSAYDWVNNSGLGVTTMAPFAADIVAKNNQFDLGNGLKLPSALGAHEMLLLESKVQHKRDFAVLGSVLFYQRVENLDTLELFDFVQDAVNDPNTAAGNEIAVSAGIYAESSAPGVGLVINKAVTITGPNAGIAGNGIRNPEAVIVPAEKLNNGGNTADLDWDAVVEIAADGVVFNGLTVSGDNTGIDSPLYAGLNHEANNGIYTHANNVQIINNILENLTYTAIEGFVSISSTPVSGFVAQNNLIQNVQDVQANGWGYGIITANHSGTISQNWIQNTRKGIQVQPYNAPISGTVDNNDVHCWERGIYMNYNQNGAKWTVNNNRVSGIAANAAMTFKAPWDGIRVEAIYSTSGGADITNNTINGALAQTDPVHDAWGEFGNDAVFGLRFVSSNSTSDLVTFSGNQISNVQHGLALESPVDVTFSGNSVTAAGDYIRLQTAYDAFGNTDDSGGTGYVNATAGNTFNGVASASASLAQLFDIEDAITHKIDMASLGLARVVATQLYVTENSGTIQIGVNAADAGDTLNVEAGLYEESNAAGVGLVINKAMTVLGPNANVAGSGTRNPEAVIVPAVVLNDGGVTDSTPVVNLSVDNVTFKGFKVSGDNESITGLSHAGMNVEAGVGIRSRANNITVANNYVEKLTLVGIRAVGTFAPPHYTNYVLQDNLVENVHDMNQFGYGFGVYVQGTTGAVSGNVVRNSRAAMDIQPYGAVALAPPTVTGNQLQGWRSGLYYNYTENGATAWTLSNNIITASVAPAAVIGGSGKVRWEGLGAETQFASANGGTFNNNQVDGTVALSDPVHATWGGFDKAVFGIRVAGDVTTSEDLVFTNNTVSNVQVGLIHEPNVNITLTGNSISAIDEVVLLQKAQDSTGAYASTGGQGSVDATAGNTFNGVASASATLPQLFDIEDVITHEVDNASLGLVRVITDNIYVTGNGNSINSGVAAAETDDIVNLKNGTYSEDVAISKYVTLLGQTAGNVVVNTGTSGVVVDMPTEAGTFNLNGINFTGTAAQALTIDAAGSAGTFGLQNLVFTGLDDASVAVAVSGSANGGTVTNVDVNNSGTGIVLANSSAITISGSDITDNYGSGILVWKWDVNNTTPATADLITIQDNIIADNGVSLDTVNQVQVVDNVEAYGILIARRDDSAVSTAVTGPSATNLVISRNTVTNNAATGIFLSQVSNDGTGANTVSGNTIEQNGQSGTVVANPTNMKNTDGIKINSSRNVSVTNNFINENQRFGVLVRSLSGETDAGAGVVVTSNHIEANEPVDYANNGQFIGGGLLIQLFGDPSKEIAATNNWWGHVYGPFNPTLNATGRGDAYELQSGTADVSNWYGFRPAAEIWFALNDRDGDGILDAYEDLNLDAVKQSLESDRAAKDSDGDLFEDGVEVALGSDPWDNSSVPNPAHALISYAQSTADADSDGYKDFYEVAFGTNPNDANAHPELGNVIPGDPIKSASDLSSLRQVLVGTKAMTLSTVEQQNMDMNRDGYVSNIDAIALRRFHGGTQTLPIK